MSSFHLQIVTPDGLFFDGEAESLDVRATTGGVTILPRHINYVTPLGMGVATVKTEGKVRKAACIGGMLAMTNGACKLIATTFEWAGGHRSGARTQRPGRARRKRSRTRSACPTPSSSSRRQSSAAHSVRTSLADTQIRTDSKRPAVPGGRIFCVWVK